MSMLREKEFHSTLKKVRKHFGFDPLIKTREQRFVEARYILFFVCRRKKMIRLNDLIDMLSSNYGYNIDRVSVIRGVSKAEKLIRQDKNIEQLVNELAK